jgi:tetratricopeptide (TPR) repeat protein
MPSIDNANDNKPAQQLFAQGDLVGAESACRCAVTTSPQDSRTHYNLGVVLAKLECFDEAITCFLKTNELDPDFAPAYTNLGFCLSALNLNPSAREAFAKARRLAPSNPVPIINESFAALASGDYLAGWQGLQARWQMPGYSKFKHEFFKPLWNGENLSGKTLFLYAEQGFGDAIQMARFIPVLAAQGAKIVFAAQPALTELFQSLQGAPQIITLGGTLPDFDCYCPIMDVPRLLGTTLETIPVTTPYLFADAAQTEIYRNMLPRLSGKRIGLSWAGRSDHENDHNRSLNFAQLAPILADNIEWVSLQRLVPENDTEALAASSVLDWGSHFADFSATAAAMMTLDLVITVDTAVAHLAGALGKPVWILLPFHADWRWLTDRTDSPWYPTGRLFRQKSRGDWGSVFTSVVSALKAET